MCADLLLTEFIVLLREMFLGKESGTEKPFAAIVVLQAPDWHHVSS